MLRSPGCQHDEDSGRHLKYILSIQDDSRFEEDISVEASQKSDRIRSTLCDAQDTEPVLGVLDV